MIDDYYPMFCWDYSVKLVFFPMNLGFCNLNLSQAFIVSSSSWFFFSPEIRFKKGGEPFLR